MKTLNFTNYTDLAQELSRTQKLSIDSANETEIIEGTDFLIGKKLKKRISFTPYIFNKCSAQCQFCSEGILRSNSTKKSYTLTNNYISKLESILKVLDRNILFLSLSGMEPLESLDFLEQILQQFHLLKQNGGIVETKVIYSNLSAMLNKDNKIIELINTYQIDRIETSRHHYNEKTNQSIMQFRDNQEIKTNSAYKCAVQKLMSCVDLKLVCVLQNTGVNSIEEVEKYILFADKMGVKQIVFRELSILDDIHFKENRIANYIAKNRVDIYNIITHLPSSFCLKQIVKGYYFLSFIYSYEGEKTITFEVSDYTEMIKNHTGDVINKLIYYPNADLCRDWNMQQKII